MRKHRPTGPEVSSISRAQAKAFPNSVFDLHVPRQAESREESGADDQRHGLPVTQRTVPTYTLSYSATASVQKQESGTEVVAGDGVEPRVSTTKGGLLKR